MMIDCTDVDLVKLAQVAYRLSVPQGLGFLSFTPEPLSEDEARQYLQDSPYCKLDMDYVHGRAIKLTVFKEKDGALSLPDAWYDHTDKQYEELLSAVGLKVEEPTEHGCACNCNVCKQKREVKQDVHEPASNSETGK